MQVALTLLFAVMLDAQGAASAHQELVPDEQCQTILDRLATNDAPLMLRFSDPDFTGTVKDARCIDENGVVRSPALPMPSKSNA